MKIEKIYYSVVVKGIVHLSTTERKEIKLKSKKATEIPQEVLIYVENYVNENGYDLFGAIANEYVIIKR